MIKFETINGQLCRMVEPTPLTLDATFPCLVRLIQNDSLRELTWVARCIRQNPLFKNSLCAYEAGSSGSFSCISDIDKLEIIGYPVVEGSAEWAWQMMLLGNMVIPVVDHQTPWKLNGNRAETEISSASHTYENWIKVASDRVWQIYEPEQSKPLLADAQVGNLLLLESGKWIQANDSTISALVQHIIKNVLYDLYYRMERVVSIEPLAPEGSAEWAWQMLNLLGLPIYHPAEGVLTIPILYGVERFAHCYAKTGWKIHKPEQESITETTPCPACHGTGFVDSVFMDEVAVRSSCSCNALSKKSSHEPEPEFKVGDCVECNGNQRLIEIIGRDLGRGNYYHFAHGFGGAYANSITRKLSPSEVRVKIMLEGTVEPNEFNGESWFCLRYGDENMQTSRIDFNHLDAESRELVESLLKAQEEK